MGGGFVAVIMTVIMILVVRKTRKYEGKSGGMTKILATNLQSEKAKSDIIINSIEDGVILIDTAKVIQLFNPAAANICGWASAEAAGLDILNVFTIIDAKSQPYSEYNNPFMQVLRTGAIVRDNTGYIETRSKTVTAINLSVTPLVNQNGELEGAVGIFRDVTKERTEEKARAEFISTASHEMRTPVAAIEGYLALAMNNKVCQIDSKAHDYLDKAHSSTEHLGKLFQDLLTSAKAEDGRLTSHPTAVEMSSFLTQLAEDLRFSAEKRGLGMEFVIGATNAMPGDAGGSQKVVSPLYYVNADPDRMREVITNIFDNAVKYTEKGKVRMSLTGDENIVQFSVADTGPGIPMEDLPHLFQKFYRVDSSATRTIGGTGLGLFICRKIVELYGGRIWAESVIDTGSTFFVNLPRLNAEQVKKLQAQSSTSEILQNATAPTKIW